MIEAQRIACNNDAWVVMSFAAKSNGYLTPSTGSMAIGQQQVIDLGNFPLAEGLEFRPDVSVAGDQRHSPPPVPPSIVFKMNGRTAFFDVSGNLFDWQVSFNTLGNPTGRPVLPGFPADIPLNVLPYDNWDQEINSPGVLTCAPQTTDHVAMVCNWAQDNGYKIRPRGVMHGWSPLTLSINPDPAARILLVDLTKRLCEASFLAPSGGLPARVKVQTGMTMLNLLNYLEAQGTGTGPAPGYSFPHTPAPGNLTVGGVLAIDAHGTAVPTAPNDDFAASYGSLSNQILEFTAAVTDPNGADPGRYVLRTFTRADLDAKAFLTHLGRALLVDATLQVVDNYNLRCQSFTNFPDSVVFAKPTAAMPVPANSFADWLNRCGRVEVIWFRTGTCPWLHVWSVAPDKPDSSTAVTTPYNYPFADHVPDILQGFVQKILNGIPSLTPLFGETAALVTANGLDGKNALGESGAYPVSRDIWGPSKNTLLYIQDTTLRVTANGYAIQMRQGDVQQAVFDFTTHFTTLLAGYEAEGKYPVNSAVEIRVTRLDDPAQVAIGSGVRAQSPVISAIGTDDLTLRREWDVALWIDVLTIPGTAHANEFYAELEDWVLQRFSGDAARALPEWSKGWGYTAEHGAWSNPKFFEHIRSAFSMGRSDLNNWKWESETLMKYDRAGLFASPLLETLFALNGRE